MNWEGDSNDEIERAWEQEIGEQAAADAELLTVHCWEPGSSPHREPADEQLAEPVFDFEHDDDFGLSELLGVVEPVEVSPEIEIVQEPEVEWISEVEEARMKLRSGSINQAERRSYRLKSGLYKLDFSGTRCIPRCSHELSPDEWQLLEVEKASQTSTPQKRVTDDSSQAPEHGLVHTLDTYFKSEKKTLSIVGPEEEVMTEVEFARMKLKTKLSKADRNKYRLSSRLYHYSADKKRIVPKSFLDLSQDEWKLMQEETRVTNYHKRPPSALQINTSSPEMEFARAQLKTALSREDRRHYRIASGLYQVDKRGYIRPKGGNALTANEWEMLQEEMRHTKRHTKRVRELAEHGAAKCSKLEASIDTVDW